MKELFPASSVKMESPRLKWVKKYGAVVERNKADKTPERAFIAWSKKYPLGPRGFGANEEEALRDLGVSKNWKLWNEL